MDAVIFVYEETKPINYRAFAQWLFYVTPNLQRMRDQTGWALRSHVLATIELDLNVTKAVAEQLLTNAVRLNLVQQWNFNISGLAYASNVEKP